MDSPIICPNCGAPNESTSSSCQFCGAPLAVPTKTKTNRKKKTKSNDSSSNVSANKVKGEPQIKYDKRIFRLAYNELEDEAKLYLSNDIVSLRTSASLDYFKYDFTSGKLHLGTTKTIISDGIKYDSNYGFYIYKEDIDLLDTFCNLNLKNCRVEGFYQGEEIIFVLVCRAFYHTIFDHSKYTDAADKLYEYYYNKKIEKEKEEEEETKRARDKAKEEEEKGSTLGGLLIIYFFISIIGGTIYCFCSDKGWLEAVFLWIKFPYTVLDWIWNLFS